MVNINSFLFILFALIAIIIATTVHEFTRALTSTILGDTLPKQKGRLTLNPIKHFEPIGFILMLATGGFGWGKPVDTTSLYYKNRKRDTLLTAIMPDIANIIVDKKEFTQLNKIEFTDDKQSIKEICIPIKIDRLGNIITKL